MTQMMTQDILFSFSIVLLDGTKMSGSRKKKKEFTLDTIFKERNQSIFRRSSKENLFFKLSSKSISKVTQSMQY